MALCTSCGNEVADSANFCTSCGQPMPVVAQPAVAPSRAAAVCPSCGAQVDGGNAFCTSCGQRLHSQPEPKAEAAPAAAPETLPPASAAAAEEIVSPSAVCTSCCANLEPGTRFCTSCGQPAPESSRIAADQKSSETPVTQQPEADQPSAAATAPAIAPEPVVAASASSEREVAPETPVQPQPVPQVAPPLYAAPSEYQPTQPGGSAFRIAVLILLVVIVAGALGSWYFWGVETIIVSSPPDVTVFLDDKELAQSSYGRYVIPHLSRQSHLLKVQRMGFADTIQRLDFPLTSLHEWVNIKLVPSRQLRSPR
jgi:rRNA maturation endonuclease Nob1